MLKALWFFIKLGLVVALVLWVASQEGSVEVNIADRVYMVDLGIALLGALVLIIITAQLYRFWRSIVTVPQWWKKYSEARDKEKGYNALSAGLVAIASGDKKKALKLAKKTKRYIPNQPLAKLLSAQAAVIAGEDKQAENEFLALIEDKQTSFLGVRGLLAQKLKDGNVDQAIQILNFADEKQPKTPWVLKKLFSLYIQIREWSNAEDVLHRAYKAKVYSKEEFKSLKAAVLLARCDVANSSARFEVALGFAKDAYVIKEDWLPAVIYYAKTRLAHGNFSEARKILEKAWKKSPHPDIARLWVKLFNEEFRDQDIDPLKKLNHVKWLRKQHPQNVHARLRYALSAMEANLYGEARTELKDLSEKYALENVFLALSDLEIKQFKDEKRSSAWLVKASQADREEEWSCTSCQAIHTDWHPICENCGDFNSIEWSRNHFDVRHSRKFLAKNQMDFLELPQD